MVDPVSSAERASFAFRVKLGLTAVIAVSAGLIAVQADAGLSTTLIAMVAGAVVGAPLVWFTLPGSGETKRTKPDGQRDREFGK